QVAQENIDRVGRGNKIKIIVGLSHESMLKMHPDTSFDLIFIDADKPGNVNYFTEAELGKAALSYIVDNVVRYGRRVADPEYTGANVERVRALLRALYGDKDLEVTTIGTVGDKGYDGFSFMYAIRM
ncbi:hypothetical protein B0H19DRAFT_955261, partial [Mycena capillaripes]